MAADWVANILTGPIHHNISAAFQPLPVLEGNRCWGTAGCLVQGKGQSAVEISQGKGSSNDKVEHWLGKLKTSLRSFCFCFYCFGPFAWQQYLFRREFLNLKTFEWKPSNLLCKRLFISLVYSQHTIQMFCLGDSTGISENPDQHQEEYKHMISHNSGS